MSLLLPKGSRELSLFLLLILSAQIPIMVKAETPQTQSVAPPTNVGTRTVGR